MLRSVYRLFAYLGLGAVFGSLLYGFRYDPNASASNYVLNLAMYLLWAGIHLVMTRGWFKRAVYGSERGSPFERQVYISVASATWLAVLWFHLPLPGPSVALAGAIRFVATVGFLFSVLAFFEGVNFQAIDGLLGVPGSRMSHSHGEETPLFTEGQYAQVRHPMYRAALLGGLCSIVLHANLAQVFWCLLIGATFILFIPIEERQLLEARGDAYRAYQDATPWRVMRGVW